MQSCWVLQKHFSLYEWKGMCVTEFTQPAFTPVPKAHCPSKFFSFLNTGHIFFIIFHLSIALFILLSEQQKLIKHVCADINRCGIFYRRSSPFKPCNTIMMAKHLKARSSSDTRHNSFIILDNLKLLKS